MMTRHEYEFLTGRWEGVKGAAWNACFGFCRSFGWTTGFDLEGRPNLTKRGLQALKAFETDERNKRIDVI